MLPDIFKPCIILSLHLSNLHDLHTFFYKYFHRIQSMKVIDGKPEYKGAMVGVSCVIVQDGIWVFLNMSCFLLQPIHSILLSSD